VVWSPSFESHVRPDGESYNQNLWMHHLTEGATYLPL
jgi:hypothetical protein